MKVIDLLNKIANGENFEVDIKEDSFFHKISNGMRIDDIKNRLNEEVEEEKKIPEKIEEEEIEISMAYGEQVCANKINEIIDYLDYLKSKGE